jgi:hypothetical protein
MRIFMIGGGASGFPCHSGAGGAGYIQDIGLGPVSAGTTISITIGAGGQRATSTPAGPAYNGSSTTVTIGSTTYTAAGGVSASSSGAPGGNGSSGGGGAGNAGSGGKGGSGGSDGDIGATYNGGTGIGVNAFNNAVIPTSGVLSAGAGGAAGNSSHAGGGGAGGIITNLVAYPTAENGGSSVSGKGGVGFGAGGGSGGYDGNYYSGGAGAPGMVYIYFPPAFSMQVDAGTAMITTSKKDVPGFPTSFMQTNSSWFVSSYFYASSLGQGNWKPIVGSAYTTTSQTGFWGIWLSNPDDYIHWRNWATPQFNDNTNLRVEVKDLWYEVIVKYDPANKKEQKFALRKQYNNASITRQTITQTADFAITGVLGNVTSGGWELATQSMEIFHGKIERVSIGVIPTRTTLSDLLKGIYPNLEVPQTFTFNTAQIGENIMVNIDKAGATLTSSPSSNISITKVSTDNWTVTISATGTYTLTYTFVDPNDFFPTITTSATVKLAAIPVTLGDFNDSKTFGTGSFNVIQPSSPSTGAFTYSITSGTDVISISGTTITILKAGSATIQASQAASGNYLAATKTATITINRAAGTLSVTKSIFYQKFVSGASVPFDVISSNAGTVYRTHESNNTSIVSIPSSAAPSATIVGPGKTTIKVTQPQQTNYEQIIEYSLVTIVIIGQGQTYTSENMTNTDFSNTNLSGSAFSSCILTNANLFGVTVNASTNLSTATLTNVRSGRIIGTTSLLPSGFKII